MTTTDCAGECGDEAEARCPLCRTPLCMTCLQEHAYFDAPTCGDREEAEEATDG